MNFDDIDFAKLSESERQEILKLWRDDKYSFYARWKNPAEVQEKMIAWQRETDPYYDEMPAEKVYATIGALKACGAPQSVVDYYTWNFSHDRFENSKPNAKHAKVVEVFKELYNDFNWDEEELPEYGEDGLDNPFNQKWLDIVDGLYFLMADGVKHRLEMGTYRKPRTLSDVIELRPTEEEFTLGTATFDKLKPDMIIVKNNVIKLMYYNCYDK